ncbi:Adenine deaminase (plasmid) [Phaeobacter piscinae]|nr:Adenine deaminase [Phaeobacter piscinae]
MNMNEFIAAMPKAELHIHIEGTVSAKKVLELAERNGVDIPYASEAEIVAAQDYSFPALENFLDYHYMCSSVLRDGRDVYEITRDFLEKCRFENIRHVEMFFDPQQHIERGVSFDDLMEAMMTACQASEVSTGLIMCMNRERSLESAMEMLDLADKHREDIIGVGLDSYEEGNPPIKFQEFYDRAREDGYRLTAHCDCDQKDAVKHAHQCAHDLNVDRIDHGLHVLDDPELIEVVRKREITLTMCPTWRPSDPEPRRLKALREMLDLGLPVCLNTDDPEEFASRYLTHMMQSVQQKGNFSAEEMTQFMRNAFRGSWIGQEQRAIHLTELEAHLEAYLQQN